MAENKEYSEEHLYSIIGKIFALKCLKSGIPSINEITDNMGLMETKLQLNTEEIWAAYDFLFEKTREISGLKKRNQVGFKKEL